MPTTKKPSIFAIRRNKKAYGEVKLRQIKSDSLMTINTGRLVRFAVETPKQFGAYIKSAEADIPYLTSARNAFKSTYRLQLVHKAMKGDSAKLKSDMKKLRNVISMVNAEIKRKKAVTN